jgi:hypothetical protein
MLGMIAVGCVLSMGWYSVVIIRAVALPVACGLSFVALQILVHGSSLSAEYVGDWIPWVVFVVVLQHLALRRGFLHRASIAMFLIGVATLPYMQTLGEHRAGLQGTIAIANPNDFGAWFGFCCVYFALLALEVRRQWVRAVAWMLAAACLLILGLTVSRAPLFAAALSIVVALRRVLKKGLLPLVFLITAAWVVVALGLFNQSAELYTQRGLEESGRGLVWPLAIGRFLDNLLTGVGASHVQTLVPQTNQSITPHNALIFIALASGVVPLLLFLAWGVQLCVSAWKAAPDVDADSPFLRVLLLYAFLISMNLNAVFMLPWVIVISASVTAAGIFVDARHARIGSRVRERVRTPTPPVVATAPHRS